MNMQDQMRKAFGHYASRQIARAHVGEKALVRPKLNPLLMKQGDDLESLLYVTPDSSAMDYDGNTLPDEKSYRRLAKRARGYEAGNRTNDYVQPPKADDYIRPPQDMSFTDALVRLNGDQFNQAADDVRSLMSSPDVIIARPDVAKELGSTVVNGFGDEVKVVSSDDIGYDYDGDTLPDEKSYRRLARRARGYEAGSLTDDYVAPPKANEYVVPPKDISFTDALARQDDNKAYVDDRSVVNASDTIVVSPEVAKEMGSVFVDDFGNRGKVVTKDQVGKQARGAGNLTDDYVQPPKYDDYVQPPKYDDYVQPPRADDYVQPPTAPDFDVSQFEMDEATKSIDDVPMGIDEGQFDMAPTKGLQQ